MHWYSFQTAKEHSHKQKYGGSFYPNYLQLFIILNLLIFHVLIALTHSSKLGATLAFRDQFVFHVGTTVRLCLLFQKIAPF